LKAGDKGAIARVQAGKKKAAERQGLSRAVAADKGKKARDLPGGAPKEGVGARYEREELSQTIDREGGSKFYKTGNEAKTVKGLKAIYPKAKHFDLHDEIVARTKAEAKKANVNPKTLDAALKDPDAPGNEPLRVLTGRAIQGIIKDANDNSTGAILSGYEKARKYGMTEQDVLAITEPAGRRGSKNPFALVVASEKIERLGLSRGAPAPTEWGGKGNLVEKTSAPFPLPPTPIKPREKIAPQEQKRNQIGRETQLRLRDKVKDVLAGQSKAISKINQQKNTKKGLEEKFLRLELLTGIKNRDILKSVGEESGLDLTYKPRKKKTDSLAIPRHIYRLSS
jgi:hypothetical protein